jgi:hypothetical protein
VRRNKKKKKNPRGQQIAEEIIRKEGGVKVDGKWYMPGSQPKKEPKEEK